MINGEGIAGSIICGYRRRNWHEWHLKALLHDQRGVLCVRHDAILAQEIQWLVLRKIILVTRMILVGKVIPQSHRYVYGSIEY